jgi:dihydrofolate reductase
MSELRCFISMSLDGFVAGPDQSAEDPLGVGGMRLHEWIFPLAPWREDHGEQGGETNASTPVLERRNANLGSVVMGRNMFGGGPGSWAVIPGGDSGVRILLFTCRSSSSRTTHANRSR